MAVDAPGPPDADPTGPLGFFFPSAHVRHHPPARAPRRAVGLDQSPVAVRLAPVIPAQTCAAVFLDPCLRSAASLRCNQNPLTQSHEDTKGNGEGVGRASPHDFLRRAGTLALLYASAALRKTQKCLLKKQDVAPLQCKGGKGGRRRFCQRL